MIHNNSMDKFLIEKSDLMNIRFPKINTSQKFEIEKLADYLKIAYGEDKNGLYVYGSSLEIRKFMDNLRKELPQAATSSVKKRGKI